MTSSLKPSQKKSSPDTSSRASLQAIREISKCELHLHLGGSWPHSFLRTIASSEDYRALKHALHKAHHEQDYHAFFEIFTGIGKIVNNDAKVQKGAQALCQWLKEDNVDYCEIRTGLKDLGQGYEHHLTSILSGLREGDALWKTETPLLLSLRRDTSLELALHTVKLAIQYREQGICAIDISGDSTVGDSKNLLPAIELARSHHFPIALHLGESHEETAEQQIWELEHFRPARIGHGVLLHPKSHAYMVEHNLPKEMCPRSSELCAMTEDAANHPGIPLMRSGHPVCVCTDDPLIFGVSLSEELFRIASLMNLSLEEVQALQRSTRTMAFSPIAP